MRVSTLQMYSQGLRAMQNQQAKLQQTEMQVSSGLRILKPSDDPSGAVKVLNLNTNIDVIDQFSRNISVATSALAFEENVVASVSNSLQGIRELVIQANNSSNPDTAKQSIAQEIYQRLEQLQTLGNTRDANGEYIFAGYKVGSPPFMEVGGNIAYQGDQGQRLVQIGSGAQVAVRDTGEDVFMKIPSGDGNIQVLADAANNGSALIGVFGAGSGFTSDTYTLTFVDMASTDSINYTVLDSGGSPVATGTYTEGENVSFAGVQFALTGMPVSGDVITVEPSQNRDIFSSIKSIADALARPAPEASQKARFHNDMAEGLTNLDQALGSINSIRSGIGARLNNVDTLDELNLDFKLQLETVLSETQDLDYAEAISRFNLQLTSLQAAQQAFVKTSSLSLFQYL